MTSSDVSTVASEVVLSRQGAAPRGGPGAGRTGRGNRGTTRPISPRCCLERSACGNAWWPRRRSRPSTTFLIKRQQIAQRLLAEAKNVVFFGPTGDARPTSMHSGSRPPVAVTGSGFATAHEWVLRYPRAVLTASSNDLGARLCYEAHPLRSRGGSVVLRPGQRALVAHRLVQQDLLRGDLDGRRRSDGRPVVHHAEVILLKGDSAIG